MAFYHPKASVYHHVPQNRMTLDYLCQRAYNEGISSSYVKVRAIHGLDGVALSAATEDNWLSILLARVRKKRLKENIAALGNRVGRALQKNSRSPNEKSSVKQFEHSKAIAAAYEAGYAFHQKAVQESEVLREWILRSNYWDAQVPNQAI